ncbi:30S ribosomal protein S8 [SAR86 cluster bacterium]|jgi:small subunit ribosomal protein S8|nr:30S ribosomal protein S8 [SAR86 cluster bacterium]
MSLQDPISDMISRIKNAQSRGHAKVSFGSSKLKRAICEVLLDEGFIKKSEVTGDLPKQEIEITLKYFEDKPVIKEFNRESKPGLRKYFSSQDIPAIKGGLGIGILTTSKGVLTDKQAKTQNIGGELICTIF